MVILLQTEVMQASIYSISLSNALVLPEVLVHGVSIEGRSLFMILE